MEFSDIFDVILLTLFLRFFWSYKKVMENRSLSSNSSVYYSVSDHSNIENSDPVQNRTVSSLKLVKKENFATSTPTLRSELGRKVLKDHFLQNCPGDLDLKMDNLSLENNSIYNNNGLNEEIRNLTIKSSKTCMPKVGRNFKESQDLYTSLKTLTIPTISPETRRKTENLYEEIFFPEPKSKISRKTFRI
jgi:hypothetical protein